ncbi:MAG TPA: (Fe-S)-binding protein [Bacteroidia bacterium]|jgi:heterodisulfide reductase subunit C|nr:(Fe-S)-binding protein [Bacteroidia bacterium]
MIPVLFFAILASASTALFVLNIKRVRRNILLGHDLDLSDSKGARFNTMLRVAFGQSKMTTRPVAAVMHLFVYIGFVLINVEVLEMFIDGLFRTHRVFSFLGATYNFMIGFFEILAFLVTLGCAVFLIRRNVIKLKRFVSKELDGWPRSDANIILCSEIILMSALFLMNAADQVLQAKGSEHYLVAGSFPVSGFIAPALSGMSESSLIFIERFCWWLHIVGIFGFLNYLPYSKHLHVLLAFPNTWYSNLNPKGKFTNLDSVTDVVKPNFDPSYQPVTDPNNPQRFGAKDVSDLNWKQLMDAYSCTECGRCTSSCPQNITGKALSPRKIMMDTRDRLVEVGKNIDKNRGRFVDDGKSLLGDYITHEEIWACNTCNACVQECPVNIDPLSIIMDLRQYLVMEQSAAPNELNGMFSNTENNGAPWQFSPSDRANWINE